jgi:predicted phage terminase large subunit-like protein
MNPERFNRNTIEELKTELGEYNFAAQHQQRPTPLGGGLIKDSWWNTWYVLPSYFDSACISMDLNTKEGINNDNTSLMVLGKKNANIYILDLIYKNMDIVKQLEEITNLCSKYPFIRAKIIEDKSNGSAVWSLLRKNIPGLIAVDPKGINKEVRIMATIPYINAGNVHIPDKEICSWIKPLLTEAVMFPKGKHDDALDTLAYGIDYLINNSSYTKMPSEIITETNNVISRKEIRNEMVGVNYGETINTNRNYLRGLFN